MRFHRHRMLLFELALVLSLCVAAGASKAQAAGQYRCRWDKVAGPGEKWTTGWQNNYWWPACFHGGNCACGSQNFCRIPGYPPGATAIYWPKGCDGPAWTIRCSCEPEI